MILFVGSEEKGHFIREVAKSYQWNAAFVHPKLDIFSQVQEILQYPDCKVIVYDVEQYVMNAQESQMKSARYSLRTMQYRSFMHRAIIRKAIWSCT